MPPATRYARNGNVHLAYQVLGDGPLDLLYVPQAFSSIDVLWEHPRVARYLERLASFSRLIVFDRRETGISDRLGHPPTLEEQMDDLIAVMDAAGSERAGVMAILEGGAMAMLFAATHPERTGALVLYAAFARTIATDGYEWANTVDQRRARMDAMAENWGRGDLIEAFAPSLAGDRRLREWLGRMQRGSMAPGNMRRLQAFNERLDMRRILPSIRVPTLILHRSDDVAMDVRHSRFLAGAIPNARLVELPGSDNLPFVGDTDAVLGEIEEFLTGARGGRESDRVLATVLMSDICGSTEIAARVGDRRWRETLADHADAAERAIAAYQGRHIKSTGDGVLATFDGPARAIRAGSLLVDEAARMGLELRVGLHTGEIEVIGEDVGGLAVHIAARVTSLAGPSEVVVSSTVRDLVVGSGLDFQDRGTHELRGVPGDWRLWTVAP